MKHRVCCVGRPGGWAKVAGEEYSKRIGRFGELECIHFREGPNVEKQMIEKGEGWGSRHFAVKPMKRFTNTGSMFIRSVNFTGSGYSCSWPC